VQTCALPIYCRAAGRWRRARNTTPPAPGRRHRAPRRSPLSTSVAWSVVGSQVHAVIEAGHLVRIAVEHQRRTAGGPEETTLADADFARLAPARMVDLRIDVGVEAIFLRLHASPRILRLLFHQRDADDRLDALEAVFPRHDQPD